MRMQAFYFLRDFCSHLARWHLPWAQLCEQQSCHCSRETADVNYKWLQVGKVGAGWIYKPCLGSFKYLVYCAVKKRGRILKKQWRPIICKPFFDVMPSYILVLTVLTAKWHQKKSKLAFTRSQEWENRRKAAEICVVTEGLCLSRKGNVPSIKHSHFCKSLFSCLAITTWQQWGRGSPCTALTRWQSCTLIKCLVALHSIVPAAYDWGESADMKGRQKHNIPVLNWLGSVQKVAHD